MGSITSTRAQSPATILLVLSINNIIRNIGFSIVSISLPRYVRDSLHMEYSAYGWLLGAFTIAQAVLEPFFARLAEKHGYKRIILASLVIFVIGTFLCGFASDFWTMLAFRAVQGTGAFYSAMLLYVNHSRPAVERSQAFATVSITITVGWMLGIVLGGWLDTMLDIHEIFFAMGVTGGSTIILSMVFLPSSHDEARIVATVRDADTRADSPVTSGAPACETRPDASEWRFKKDFLLLNIVNFTRNAVFQAVLSFLIFYVGIFLATWHLPDGLKGIVILPMVITYIAFVLFGGARKVLDRHGKVRVILIAFVVLLPFIFGHGLFFNAMVVTPYASSASWIWFLFLLFTCGCAVGFGLPQAPVTTLSMEYLPAKQAGYLAGLFNTVMFFAGAVGPVIFSAFVDLEQADIMSPPFFSFAGMGILLVLVTLLTMRLNETRSGRH